MNIWAEWNVKRLLTHLFQQTNIIPGDWCNLNLLTKLFSVSSFKFFLLMYYFIVSPKRFEDDVI